MIPESRLPARWTRHRHLGLLAGLCATALAAGLAWGVIGISEAKSRTEYAAQAQLQLLQVREQLDRQLQSALSIPETVAAFIAAQGDLPPEVFAAVVGRLVDHHRYVRNVALAPDNVIRQVYPLPGNEKAVGLRYSDQPAQREAVERAIRNRRTVVAGPVRLVQGGLGISSRTPVFLDAVGSGAAPSAAPRYWGIVSLTVNADALFEDVGLGAARGNLLVAARGRDATGGAGAVFAGRAEVFEHDPVILEYPLPGGGSWQLGAVPASGWQAAGRVPAAVALLSYAFALLLGLLTARLVRTHQHVQALALHDRVTGLPNRRLLEDRLSQALLGAQRDHRLGALLLLDLDGFKQVNDAHGHAGGDQVLMRIGQRLQAEVRASDTAARLGGDEFAVLLSTVEAAPAALEVARKLALALSQPMALDSGAHVVVGASIGVALFSGQDPEPLPALLARADKALYECKRQGGALVRLAEPAAGAAADAPATTAA